MFSLLIHIFGYTVVVVEWVSSWIPPERLLFDAGAMEVALLPSPKPVALSPEPVASTSEEAAASEPAPRPSPPKPTTVKAPKPRPAQSKPRVSASVSAPKPTLSETPSEIPHASLATTARFEANDPSPLASVGFDRTLDIPTYAGSPTRPSVLPDPAPSRPCDGDGVPSTDVGPDEAASANPRVAQIGQALQGIAQNVAAGGGPQSVDIVFLLDISGSMEDNIRAVGTNLVSMMKSLQQKGYDATFGMVKFALVTTRIFPQTREAERYERLLDNIKVGGDERALNAMDKAMKKVRFRDNAQHRFVVITDEPLKGSPPLNAVLQSLRESRIVVDVIGMNIASHRLLARQTGGTWYQLPGASGI